MGELNMIMENHYYLLHLFHVCWHFDKGVTSYIDDILHDHVDHVPCSRVKMSAEVLGCTPPLIELKFFFGSPNTIYFHIKKVLEVLIKVENSKKNRGNNS